MTIKFYTIYTGESRLEDPWSVGSKNGCHGSRSIFLITEGPRATFLGLRDYPSNVSHNTHQTLNPFL